MLRTDLPMERKAPAWKHESLAHLSADLFVPGSYHHTSELNGHVFLNRPTGTNELPVALGEPRELDVHVGISRPIFWRLR